MAQNELQLVTYEQAKRLKAAGFDWYTDFSFINEDIVRRIRRSNAEVADRAGEFCAPTVALALKWFRDTQKVTGLVTHNSATRIYHIEFYFRDKYEVMEKDGWGYYEGAEFALLNALLTELEDEQCSGK